MRQLDTNNKIILEFSGYLKQDESLKWGGMMKLINMQLRWALTWCDPKGGCACMGCANISGGYKGTQEEWQKEIDNILEGYGYIRTKG